MLERDRKALGGERPSTSPTAQFDIGGGKSDQFLPYLHENDDDEGDEVEDEAKGTRSHEVDNLERSHADIGSGAGVMNHQTGLGVSGSGSGGGAVNGRYANEQFVRYLCHKMTSDVLATFGDDAPDEDDDQEVKHGEIGATE